VRSTQLGTRATWTRFASCTTRASSCTIPAVGPSRDPKWAETLSCASSTVFDAWDTESVDPIGDFIDAGDRALLRLAWHTTGRGLGSRMEVTHVATVRDGRIVRNDYFWDHAEALEAVGLSE